jgi:hypothetical protein
MDMKNLKLFSIVGLVIFSLAITTPVSSSDATNYEIWLGGSYLDISDYGKKIGEYESLDKDFRPGIKGSYFNRADGNIVSISGQYDDAENISGEYKQYIGDSWKGELYYHSMIHQGQQDLLENLQAREWLTTKPGGKMLTHEIADPGADYQTKRVEWGGMVEAALGTKHNIKMRVAHRSIIKTGEEQSLASNHCFSCHVTSNTREVDNEIRQTEIGVQGDIGNFTAGYDFGYRLFKSSADEIYAYFDKAVHPVLGTKGAEFGSRVIYSDTWLPIGVLPESDKFSHKVKFRGNLGKAEFTSSAGYNRTRNKNSDLKSDAWNGAINFVYPLNNTTRLIGRISGTRLTADDPFIDLPTYRAGRPGPQTSFDGYRFSSLDRAEGRGSVELISRLNKKLTLAGLLGFNLIDRYDYPEDDSHYKTKKFFGQAKIKFRPDSKISVNAKYRMEMISDPFTSGRGLFEARGREALGIPLPGFAFAFYWQREALRYQAITTQPTDVHQIDISAAIAAAKGVNINAGLKGKFDKNGDLDSLDVKHSSLSPHLSLAYNPDPKWSLVLGYTMNMYKSRGPVTTALFDG